MDLAVQENNLVIHPKHYNTEGRPECWEEMRRLFGDECVGVFDVLNAYKYLYRAGEKEGNPAEQDMAKIYNYMRHCADLVTTSEQTVTKAKRCYTILKKELKKNDKD